jgi:hypothetical protein
MGSNGGIASARSFSGERRLRRRLLAYASTTGNDRRTPGHPQPNDQEQSKYGTRSHRDALEKPEYKYP